MIRLIPSIFPTAPQKLIPIRVHAKPQSRRGQRGNVFAMLFAAVALTGVLASVGMQTLTGPVTTITRVTQKNIAETNMMMNARIISNAVPLEPGNGDFDADNTNEAAPFVKGVSGETPPANGGYLPTNLGLALTDPWGTKYGYCSYDHGTNTTTATPSGTDYIEGDDRSPTHISTEPLIAIISAGADKEFQTGCPTFDGTNTMSVTKAGGSDDLVQEFTYDGASAAAGGLWTLNAPTGNVAQLKDSAGTAKVSIDRASGVGDFLGVTTDTLSAKTDVLEVVGGFRLDTSVSDALCVALTDGAMRYNATSHKLEICNGTAWVPVGSDLWKTDGTNIWREGSANVGINNATPTANLDVTGTTAISSTLGVGGATSLASTLGVTGATTLSSTLGVTGATTLASTLGVAGNVAVNTDKFTISATTGNTDIAGTLGVDGATTLGDTLDVTGATALDDTLSVGGGATLASTLTVAGATSISNTLGVSGSTSMGSTLTVAGNTAIDTDTLFVDATTNRVGIGTSTPGAALEVVGGIKFGIHTTCAAGGTNNGTIQYDNSVKKMQVCVDGTWNNVSAIDKLDDIGDVDVPSPNNNDILAWNSTDNRWEAKNIINIGPAAVDPAGANGSVQFKDGSDLGADAANFHWDDTNNRLGIGTNSPTATLTVVGTTSLSGNTSVGGTLNVTGDATFDTNTLFIDATQNIVGIGTLTPKSALEVVGAIKLGAQTTCAAGGANDGTIRFGSGTLQMCVAGTWSNIGASNTGFTGTTAPDAIECGISGTRRLLYLQTTTATEYRYGFIAGSNGIGMLITYAVADGSHVSTINTAGWSNATGCDGKALTTLAAENRSFYMLGGSGATGLVTGAAGAGSEIQFRNAGTGAFSADSNFVWDDTNNRLGIGTAAPTSALHVNGGIQLADDSATCPGTSNVKLGTMRFNAGALQVCLAGGWSGTAGITELTGDVTAGPGTGSVAATIANNAVTTVKIANSAVTSIKIQDGTIATADIANSAIDTSKLGADAVTSAKIADDAVSTEHIVDGSITAADLGADSVGSSEIATDAVNTAEIAAKAMTYAKIQDVTSNRLLGRVTAGNGVVEEITIGTGLQITGTTLSVAGGGTIGDVTGPASSTDNALTRFDGTTGKIIQNSNAILEDTGRLSLGSGVTPTVSSLLDLASTTLGFLPPRMTSTQRDAIATPASGLVIYNTTTKALETYNGVGWISGGSSGSGSVLDYIDAADLTGAGYTSVVNGTLVLNANNECSYVTTPMSGDFTLNLTTDNYVGGDYVIGAFASSEIGAFVSTSDRGGMNLMTNSFWIGSHSTVAAYKGASVVSAGTYMAANTNHQLVRAGGQISFKTAGTTVYTWATTYSSSMNLAICHSNGNAAQQLTTAYFINGGSGAGGGVPLPDSLDFTEFKDAMLLDASTDISVTGTNQLSITNTGTGLSLRVNDDAADTSPFVIDAAGQVGVGIAVPTQAVDVVGKITTNAMVMKLVSGAALPTGGSSVWTAASGNVYRNTGNVGVGTNNPSNAKLVVSEATLPGVVVSGKASSNIVSDVVITRSSSGAGVESGPSIRMQDGTNNNTTLIQNTQGAMTFWNYGAGSWQEKMRVGNDGKVGIGTNNPAFTLDVDGSAAFRGNSSQIRIKETDNADPQDAWHFSMNGANLAFLHEDASAGPSYVFAMTMTPAGRVGIGETSPGYPLQVNSAGDAVNIKTSGPTGTYFMRFATGTGSGAGTIIGTIAMNGTSAVLYNTTSDRRLKENIVDTAKGIDTLMRIQIKDYNFIADKDKTAVQGFIAQQLYTVYPEAVTKGDDGDKVEKSWSVDYGRITPLIVKAIQDVKQTLDDLVGKVAELFDIVGKLQKENAELKAQNADILKRLEALEAKP